MAIQAMRRSARSFEVIAHDTLTMADVDRIVAALARRPEGALAVIDLRLVRTCEPWALSRLDRSLADAGVPHVLRGLTHTHRRLLRYLRPVHGTNALP
ncbi:MAG TPA: hypothetical protein VFP65_12970 [Anaeromyxobacteraceae bacterium]|nr:hypothetical protein [Anaeromyxobacteraceae bacterium]